MGRHADLLISSLSISSMPSPIVTHSEALVAITKELGNEDPGQVGWPTQSDLECIFEKGKSQLEEDTGILNVPV